MARVVLAMSGGVDSSVAAHLLTVAGHEVIGVFMRHGARPDHPARAGEPTSSLFAQPDEPGSPPSCCSAADAEDARRVAGSLDIPFYAIGLESEFRDIMDYFVEEYVHGRTPNPCIVCNNRLKFGKLFDYANDLDAEYLATGHHARCLLGEDGLPWLCRGADRNKDQSYALFGIPRHRFQRILLPVGGFRKREIRQKASELGLRVADKRDSQDICFVSSGNHAEFVHAQPGKPDTSGNIVTTDGAIVGHHAGIERFTIGQRKGLNVAMGVPYFVVRIDPQTCDVVIGRREQLTRHELTAAGTNWLAPPPAAPIHCHVKIRYNAAPVPATVTPLADNRLRVQFDEPVSAVSPGQAVVCYDGERVLGGGWIESESR